MAELNGNNLSRSSSFSGFLEHIDRVKSFM